MRVFCRDCGRLKHAFETEGSAKAFLKFNADEIEEQSGKRPIRAYYCEQCMMWHVTAMQESTFNLMKGNQVYSATANMKADALQNFNIMDKNKHQRDRYFRKNKMYEFNR